MITIHTKFKPPIYQGFTAEEWSALESTLDNAIREARVKHGAKESYMAFLMQLQKKVSRNERTAVFLTREALKEWQDSNGGVEHAGA